MIEPETPPAAGQSRGTEGSLRARVRSAVFWRSGSQIVAQMIAWAATFLVIRMLDPADYGLFAMATMVVVFLGLFEGFGFASSLIQREEITREDIRQVFGVLILLSLGLAAAQLMLAPLAAAYFREPEVATLLRVQVLLHLTTPFIALPFALLSRELEYRKQAFANLAASIAGAATALTLALLGFGVWTLVYAPIVLFAVKAAGLTYAARSLIWPSFRFKGAGAMIGFGGALTVTQIFWFLQSQSDVFIAGRAFDVHLLGLYTTSLFLVQILVSKFVPPLNDVAFAAYSRMHREEKPIAPAFANAARLIMTIALPFYFGLAITAEPLIATILGEQWLETIPIVHLLAMAMPFMTLQILFAPATNSSGKPWIATRVNMAGAAIMATGFVIGAQFGIIGMAWAWIFAFPILTAVTMIFSMPAFELKLTDLLLAILPSLAASLAMAGIVIGVDSQLPVMTPASRLGWLVATGIFSYGALLWLFARDLVAELWQLVRHREPAFG
ncbi:MAG: lipopolysaccharide biosynthesis protein [Parasphingopyxis sp.]|uniref:lipopolysaccharide biosynthesis protein n=1 Tax=Parasphingopyxis sp. TaxID=1920299 RepID=UPI0032EB1C30